MNQILHKKHLMDILLAIYRDPFLAHNLYFKGGTAFYLFYDLPRFSTDLDFDLAFDFKDYRKIFDSLKSAIRKFGIIKDERMKLNTIFFVLSYEKHQRLIKIEVSCRDFGHESIEIKNIFGVDIKLLALDLLCAHKLVALIERTKARDLFDAYFILQNGFPINEDIVKKRTNFTLADFFKKLGDKIEKDFSRKNVLHELGEVIMIEKKCWVREKLKEEVLALLKRRMQAVLPKKKD